MIHNGIYQIICKRGHYYETRSRFNKAGQPQGILAGQYDFFSHFEYISGVPQTLFLIATQKENGKPNVCFHSWSAFSGDSGGFFAVLTGLMQHTHTYKNILRAKEFCVKFISAKYYDNAQATIKNNDDESDEAEMVGFTVEKAQVVKSPRIKEAFLTFECKLRSHVDLSGKGISAMVVGEVVHAAVEGDHADAAELCGENAFMQYVHAPKSPATGDGSPNGVIAILHPIRPE
jgi:flavin reductase (DIM6/NTAB) family NADH-FMN oxidoreductase RutF